MPFPPLALLLSFFQQDDPGLDLFREVVRPALERHCVECHNPDKAKAGFDLSTRAALLAGSENGEMVVPGSAEDSVLQWQIDHEEKPFMPHKKPQLGGELRRDIGRWIDAGAPYDGALNRPDERLITDADRAHWAFAPLPETDPGDPSAAVAGIPAAAARSLDAWIDQRLSASALHAGKQAPPHVLLRRATLDLTGLPATLEEQQRFRREWKLDPQQAWTALVERLLASPHYGERWGRHWLDAARYADSGGYEFDVERPNAWPYRDWVVRALNEDLPYDEFLRLQLAGDELRPDDPSAHAATGFLTAGPVVSNQQTEQNRYDELDDVLATTGSAMLGLTLACARCHDHKFDPIPQRDYYQILAAFTGTERHQRPLLEGAALVRWQEARRKHQEQITRAEQELSAAREGVRAAIVERRLSALELTEGDATLLRAPQDPLAPQWRYTFRDPGPGWAEADFDDRDWPQGPGGFGRRNTPGARLGTEWTSDQVWLRRTVEVPEHMREPGLVLHHDEDLRVSLDGVVIFTAEGFLRDYRFVALDVQALRPFAGRSATLAVSCRQSSGGQFVDVHLVDRAELTDGPLGDAVRMNRWTALRQRHGADLEVNDEQLAAEASAEESASLAALESQLQEVRAQRPAEPQRVLALRDRGRDPAPTWLLGRGDPGDKREQVEVGFLRVLTPAEDARLHFPVTARAHSSGRRSALAAWMTAVEHGAGRLVARVEANRIWQHHFGRGLVPTPGDFGTQATTPSHPQLLDELARRLIGSGWSRKALHRAILHTRAYRRLGQWTPQLAEVDADNLLLSYRPPLRLEAEALRDSMLAVSGCLNPSLGGPGVRPWIHADVIATGSTNKWPQAVVDGPATWRRSIYVFVRRSVMMPTLETFDLPNAAQSCTRRDRTTTPTQALALLNNPFVRAQAQHFAERLRQIAGNDHGAQIDAAFALALARPPDPDERSAAAAFLAEHDLVDLCQVMFNLNEFLYLP